MSSSGTSNAGSSVWVGCIPKSGAKVIPITLPLDTATSVDIDLFAVQGQGWLEFVQALFIDNSQNGQPLTITVTQSQQVIVIPANAQAYMPVLAPNPPKFNFASTGGVAVRVHFCDFFMPPIVWQ